MIKIISDSTCDLNGELIERYGITVLPLHVILGGKEYRDGVDITPDDIYKWADEMKTTPKTSAPGLEDTMDIFKQALDAGDEIIAFSISSAMSACYEYMRMAADETGADDRISIIDSANLSTGIGHLVIEAAIKASEGMARREIVSYIESLKERVRSSFVVDTLTYLYRGGRCSGLTALAGGALKIHPKIEVRDGNMLPTKKYRGKYSQIVLDYAKDMEADLLNAVPDRVFITHSGIDPATVDSVKAYLEGLGHFKEIFETRAGGVISCHCGYGTLGVLFIAGN